MPPNLFGESDKTVIQNDEVGLFGLYTLIEPDNFGGVFGLQ